MKVRSVGVLEVASFGRSPLKRAKRGLGSTPLPSPLKFPARCGHAGS